MGKAEEYLRRMKALGYTPSLAGMDDADIEYELRKMDQGQRESQAEQPLYTRYKPVDKGLEARLLRQMGRPYDPKYIPKGEEFYIGGWDNGEDDAAPAARPGRGMGFAPARGGVGRPDWNAGGNSRQRTSIAAGNSYAGGYANGGAEGDMLFGVTGVTPMLYPNLTDEQKLFAATVAGEAGGSSEAAQRAVANVIMNRVGYKEWKDRDTIGKNLTQDQFSSINDPNNQPFQEMTEYLKNRDGSNPRLERQINMAMNVYHSKEPDSTGGAVIFYSPKAQAEKNKYDPIANPNPPPWNFHELQELVVPGAEDDDFRFYKYK